MNRSTVKSLFLDALYQVLDNLGFRILLILFLVPVALSFLIVFGEQSIRLLWVWELGYADVLPKWLIALAPGFVDRGDTITLPDGFRDWLLQWTAALILDQIADKFGLIFGIAATAFFVPQMLERGAADVTFSKPVSRAAQFLSRYAAGLVFVSLLALMIVGGITLGLAVSSRYFDAGFLWSMPTLVYGFAIFHAISCTIGVFTRNTIAAILLTLLFMPANYGMHWWWEIEAVDQHSAKLYAEQNPDKKMPADDSSVDEQLLDGLLTAYHVLAPKSRDATRIAQGWRRSLEPELEFRDEDTGVEILTAPPGFEREPRSSFSADGLMWIAPHPDGAGEARWTLREQAVSDVGSRFGLTKKLRKELSVEPTRADIGGYSADRFEWVEDRGGEKRLRRRWLFQVADSVVTLDYDAEATWARTPEQETAAQVFVASVRVGASRKSQLANPDYDTYFGWNAPWRFNAWFSVGTTLAFIVAVLALGIAKLKRIDF